MDIHCSPRIQHIGADRKRRTVGNDEVGSAYSDLAPTDGLAPLAGMTTQVPDSAGILHPTRDHVLEDLVDPTTQTIQPPTENEVRKDVSNFASATGLTVQAIRFEKPDGLAPVVVAETADPAGFVKKYVIAPNSMMLTRRSAYDGSMLEVVDSTGSPVALTAFSTRDQANYFWTRPDLVPCGGAESSGTACP